MPAGNLTLSTEDGQKQQLSIGNDQAAIYRVTASGIQQESVATLVSNTGNAGQLAPPLVAKDRRGRLYRLAESLLKTPIVVLFWQVEDEDSINQLTQLGAVASKFGDGVETVAIHTNPNTQKDAQRLYLSQPGTSAQLWGDAEIASQFGVTEVPALAVIDRNGRITLLRTGTAAELFLDINDYLESL